MRHEKLADHTLVFFRGDPDPLRVATRFQELKHLLLNEKLTWVQTIDLAGVGVMFRTSDIVQILESTPRSRQFWIDLEWEDEKEDWQK